MMNRLLRVLISAAVPAHEREWVLGDVEEEYAAIEHQRGPRAARRWLRGETMRVIRDAWRFRQKPSGPATEPAGDPIMRTVLRDASFAFRAIRRSPGFAAAAVLTIAVGAGANAAVSALTYGVLFKPLPYAAPDRLVAVWPDRFMSQADLRYLREHARGLSSVSAVAPGWTFSLTGAGDPIRISVDRVSANLFETLGTPALLGRAPSSGEDAPGSPGLVVLSHRFWRERFGSDPSVVGRIVQLDDRPHEIIGVMPPRFELFRPKVDAWAPLPADPGAWYDRLNFSLLVARLEPATPADVIDSAFRALMPAMRADMDYPEGFGRTARLQDLRESTTGTLRSSLLLLTAAVAFIFVIAGANLGTLTIARGTARMKELAIHSAIGASRSAVTRLQMMEVLLLAAIGGLAGLALAFVTLPLLVALLPPDTPRLADVRVDATVALFVFAAALVVAIVFGLAPSVAAGRTSSGTVLREGGSTQSGAARRIRGAMVTVQVALALVLTIGAGLMLQSLWRLHRVDAGIDIDRILTLRLQPTSDRYKAADATRLYYSEVLQKVAAVPGVVAAGAIQHLPFSGLSWIDGYEVEGQPVPAGSARPTAGMKLVTGDYFAAVGQPLVAGRKLTPGDELAPGDVLVINAALARKVFGAAEHAVGRRMRTGRQGGPWRTVVGVVGDVRTQALDTPAEPELYQAIGSTGVPPLMLAVRTAGNPIAVAPAVREAIWSVDRTVPIADLQSMSSLVGTTLGRPRLLLTLLGGFAVTGLLLAAIGIYGVVAFAVTRRRREVGIRIALGAARSTVIRLMLRESAGYVLMGLAAGLAVSVGSARLIGGLLFEVSATSPLIYTTLLIAVTLLTLVAGYVPARRAAALDPSEALRADR